MRTSAYLRRLELPLILSDPCARAVTRPDRAPRHGGTASICGVFLLALAGVSGLGAAPAQAFPKVVPTVVKQGVPSGNFTQQVVPQIDAPPSQVIPAFPQDFTLKQSVPSLPPFHPKPQKPGGESTGTEHGPVPELAGQNDQGLVNLIRTDFKSDSAIQKAYSDVVLATLTAQTAELAQAQTDRTNITRRNAELYRLQTTAFADNANVSRFIFYVVHVVLLLGLAAAFSEFLHARRLRGHAASNQPIELKLGMEGIAIKTALHGIALLVLSMAFYFLYLKFVYTLTPLTL